LPFLFTRLIATVTFQFVDGEGRFWRGWYSADDTEERIAQRAQRATRVNGALGWVSFWAGYEGIRTVVTYKRKEVTMRWFTDEDQEIKVTPVYLEDTPRPMLDRLGFKSAYHIVDIAGRRPSGNCSMSQFGNES
jgi:hypothetical protein